MMEACPHGGDGHPSREEEAVPIRAVGGLLFVVGLGLVAKSRARGWKNEQIDWEEAQRRGDTDWRWGVPGLLLVAAGIVLLG
jgi:hypothetical protein